MSATGSPPDDRPVTRDAGIAILLAVLALAAIVLRVPEIVLEPRFWAEEARVYFAHALSAPALEALTAPHQGYYSLVPNLATWLATLVPLERAPAVTTAIALAVQALPAVVAATGSGDWVATPMRRCVVVLTVLLVGAAGELHATTICAQFHLAVLAAVIYLDAMTQPEPARRAVYAGLLLVCGLTGMQALMLLPLFAWRWWWRGGRFDTIAFTTLTLCLVIQSAIVLTAPGEADRWPLGDGLMAALANAGENLLKGMVIHPIAGDLGPKTLNQPYGQIVAAIGGLGIAAAVVTQLLVLRRGPGRGLLAAAWFVAILWFLASRRMAGGERYLELPAVLVVLTLALVAFDAGRSKALRSTAGVAVAAALAVNAWLYLPRTAGIHDPAWPLWREEVAAWRAGTIAEPRIHPQWKDAVWTVTLPADLR